VRRCQDDAAEPGGRRYEEDPVTAGTRRIKSVEDSIRDTDEPEHRLKKHLSGLDLTVFGVGVIIGTGIFVLTGVVARDQSGPAVAISFVIAGVVCGLAALCYAEFASTVPVAGSAYTFSYATFGELIAWIIGWDLVLELALGAATVAVGWSGYLNQLLGDLGIPLPESIAGETANFNIPAVVVVLLMTTVLVLGIKLSSRVTAVIVAIKLAIVLLVIAVGLFFVKAANYTPFVPPAQPAAEGASGWDAPLVQTLFGFNQGTFGWGGVIAGAAVVFFAFIGFDIVATAAEETRNPGRDLPRGILGSLAICTVLYVAVSLVVVGMQNYTELSADAPLAGAFAAEGLSFFSGVISLGALAGLTSVVMILMLGQSRVLFAMSRDHLLPPTLARVHPKYGTPATITIATGIFVAVLAAVVPLEELANLVNIGTLFAFVLVSIGVIVLRRTRPELPRAFRVPLMPVLPIVSALACLWLMLNLPGDTWVRFLGWMVLGVVIYFVYGRRKSRFNTPGGREDSVAANAARRA
jgi:basic amino acid/polyamine antiporter, APA family